MNAHVNYTVTATLEPGGREHAIVVTAPDPASAAFRAALTVAEAHAESGLPTGRPSQARVISVEEYHPSTDSFTGVRFTASSERRMS